MNNHVNNNIAIFGGTFDPIHNGHLFIAQEIIKLNKFNKLIFIPNNISPFKNKSLASNEHRLAMLKLAMDNLYDDLSANINKNINNIELLIETYELEHQGSSYTVNTLEYLEDKYKQCKQNNKFWLILGQDVYNSIDKWHQPDKIKQLANFVIVNRDTEKTDNNIINNNIYLNNKLINISATEIRSLLNNYINNKKIKTKLEKMLPKQVLAYIIANNLYKTKNI